MKIVYNNEMCLKERGVPVLPAVLLCIPIDLLFKGGTRDAEIKSETVSFYH